MATIDRIFGLRNPTPSMGGATTPMRVPDPTLVYGVELEIEHANSGMAVIGMHIEPDGSLRNEGLEFITEPMKLPGLISVLSSFFTQNDLSSYNYSERTSIHVHTNCQDMTPEQVASVCVLYQVFEKLLFEYVGDDRSQNIFCVPWAETNVSYRTAELLSRGIMDGIHDWYKYTALNLLPLTSLGTIEWRHMSGHCNVHKIVEWCQIIGCIFAYAKANKYTDVVDLVLNLNTSSNYTNVLERVFGEQVVAFRFPNTNELLEDGVLNMKYMLLNPAKPKLGKATFTIPNMTTEDVLRMWEARPTAMAADTVQFRRVTIDNPAAAITINPTNPEVQF